MNVTQEFQKKITLAIYDHKNMTQKANKMLRSLKEVEKTLDSVGKPREKTPLKPKRNHR